MRSFGFVLATGFLLIFAGLIPWIKGYTWVEWPKWPFMVAGVSSGLGLIFPAALKPVYIVWIKMGGVLGWINTRIILGLVFYLMVTPISFLMRIFGKIPIEKSFDTRLDSYRKKSTSPPVEEHMKHPY